MKRVGNKQWPLLFDASRDGGGTSEKWPLHRFTWPQSKLKCLSLGALSLKQGAVKGARFRKLLMEAGGWRREAGGGRLQNYVYS